MIDAFERWLLRNIDQEGRAKASSLASLASRALLGTITLTCSVVFIGVAFRNIVAPVVLNTWLTAMGTVIAAPIVLSVAFAIHGPATEKALRPYLIWARVTTFCLSALIASMVWLFLPHASLPLQLVMLMLLVTFVAMVLGADSAPISMVLQLCVIGSAIGFVLVYRLPYATPLATVLAAVALSLVGLHRLTYNAMQAVIAARAETERTNLALEAALAELARQRDAKARFFSAASHDLRQPVQAAALYFEHTLSIAEPDLKGRAVAGVRQAFVSVDSILETMLEHLQFESTAPEARLEAVALNSVFLDVIAQLSPLARAAGMDCVVVASEQWVMADVRLLHRVLSNLVGNAIRHSGAKRLLLGARRSREAISIWIIDNGCGIRAQDAPHLFDDYFRGGGENAAPGGFGIGLSSSRRMMQLMHGQITLDHRWKQGAAFQLRFPAADAMREKDRCKAA